MLTLTKNGLSFEPLSPKEIEDLFNFRLFYVLFDTPAIRIISRMTGMTNGDIRRKIKQGGVWIGDAKITDPYEKWSSGNVGCFVFVGKEPVGILMPIKNGVRE